MNGVGGTQMVNLMPCSFEYTSNLRYVKVTLTAVRLRPKNTGNANLEQRKSCSPSIPINTFSQQSVRHESVTPNKSLRLIVACEIQRPSHK